MNFRLVYEGTLRANGSVAEKQMLRRSFHVQLAELWKQRPLRDLADPNTGFVFLNPGPPSPGKISVIFPLDGFQLAPLVTERLNLICHLDILFLRREVPGRVLTQGGDIDNRLKTLLDSLRMPKSGSGPLQRVPHRRK